MRHELRPPRRRVAALDPVAHGKAVLRSLARVPALHPVIRRLYDWKMRRHPANRPHPFDRDYGIRTGGEAVRAFTILELEGDRVARLQNYFYNPGLLIELGGELGVPVRSSGHLWWRLEAA